MCGDWAVRNGVAVLMLVACAHNPSPAGTGERTGTLLFAAEVSVDDPPEVSGTVELRSPRGDTLWRSRWETQGQKALAGASVPFNSPGAYEVRVLVGEDHPVECPLVSMDVRSATDALKTAVRIWRSENGIDCDVGGRVWASEEGEARLKVVVDPGQGSAVYFVTGLAAEPPTRPFLYPDVFPVSERESARPSGTFNRRDRPSVSRGEWCGMDTARDGYNDLPWSLVSEDQWLCSFKRIPAGTYEQVVAIDEVLPEPPGRGTRRLMRTLLVTHRFTVGETTPVPLARHVFSDVAVSHLTRLDDYESALKAPDGSVRCVCVGARVGTEAMRVVDMSGGKVTLQSDDGKQVVLEARNWLPPGDYPEY
jgi:hypothetical protein